MMETQGGRGMALEQEEMTEMQGKESIKTKREIGRITTRGMTGTISMIGKVEEGTKGTDQSSL